MQYAMAYLRPYNHQTDRDVLQKLVRYANFTDLINDAVAMTAALMIDLIDESAPTPTCTTKVCDLAAIRGKTANVIHLHTRALIDTGLALNTCRRGSRRDVVYAFGKPTLYGINFSPLFARADELCAAEME